nr:hypothetical protein [Tanacetum cinerariifolium]GFB10863.1 hypothetical protein [Tanacetum cinerariifolium]
AIDASRVMAAKKRKRNASLDVVAEAMDALHLSSLAMTIEMPVVVTIATLSLSLVSSATLVVGIIVHTKFVDPANYGLTDLHLNVDGDGVQNDDDPFNSSVLDKPEDKSGEHYASIFV